MPEESRLILPAGIKSPTAKVPEVLVSVVPCVGRWFAHVKRAAAPEGEPLEALFYVQAWGQVRRGQPSVVMADDVQATGPRGELGVQRLISILCPLLPMEPLVFVALAGGTGGLVPLSTAIGAGGWELVIVAPAEHLDKLGLSVVA